MKKKKQLPAFGNAPTSEKISAKWKKEFDEKPAWQRQFIDSVVKTGDFAEAAKTAGVSTYVSKNVDLKIGNKQTIQMELIRGGLDATAMVEHIKECLNAETIRTDRHGNTTPFVDLKLKLETLKLVAKMHGFLDEERPEKILEKKMDAIDLFQDVDENTKT